MGALESALIDKGCTGCSQKVMLLRQKHIGATGYIHAGSVVERFYVIDHSIEPASSVLGRIPVEHFDDCSRCTHDPLE